MSAPTVDTGFAAFTLSLICCSDQYLMLQRSSHKAFAPGLWTGIGGRVESNELGNIYASARREIMEETDYQSEEVGQLVLRRTLLQQRPDHPVTVIFYFTGDVSAMRTSPTEEGILHWKSFDDIQFLNVIENTRLIIPLLIEDRSRDPEGTHLQIPGACLYDAQGNLSRIVWADKHYP